MSPRYGRVLLKLSGEALMGEQQFGIDPGVTTLDMVLGTSGTTATASYTANCEGGIISKPSSAVSVTIN